MAVKVDSEPSTAKATYVVVNAQVSQVSHVAYNTEQQDTYTPRTIMPTYSHYQISNLSNPFSGKK